MLAKDYTQKKYAGLIECLADRYPSYTIPDYAPAQRSQSLPESFFIMGHDVDGNILNGGEIQPGGARNNGKAGITLRPPTDSTGFPYHTS